VGHPSFIRTENAKRKIFVSSSTFNNQQHPGAPHLARFSRDVGYHEP
jgi:hypothetical protein